MRLPGPLLLALLMILAVPPLAEASGEKRVLLHSYHAGIKWVERIHQSARKELQALRKRPMRANDVVANPLNRK
ncbi:MAG: hypothetical protein G8D28_10655 [gamma proteobacterium symbiont of Phacoides pectinatus]